MKKFSGSILSLLILCCVTASAQLKMPQPSSTQTIIQEFGLGQISVTYSRPNMRGRDVFNDLAPYGEVWRTGANNATVIKFTDDVTLQGKEVKAGEYALFTIPGKESWTVILNKAANQWGSYRYKAEADVLRVNVKPLVQAAKLETFSIGFSDVTPTAAVMYIAWDKVRIPVQLKTDIDARVMGQIETAMKGEKKPYMEAAVYYYENGKDLNKALEWITAADDGKSPWYKYWKAKIQLKAGDKAGAKVSAQEGIKAAEAMKLAEYIRLNNSILNQAVK